MSEKSFDFFAQKSPQFFVNLLTSEGFVWGSSKDETIIGPYQITTEPFKIKKEDFELIKESALSWNKLYIKVSQDIETITKLHEKSSDELITNLLHIAEKAKKMTHQKVKMLFTRQDYIFSQKYHRYEQTEINLYAPGVFSCTHKAQKLHKVFATLLDSGASVLEENCLVKVIDYFEKAIEIYKKQYPGSKPMILITARGDSGDKVQQAQVEKQILLRGIKVVRLSFERLYDEIQYNEEDGKLTFQNTEVGFIYFRQGLRDTDYPNPNCWKVREMLEFSRAIKLPNASIQLVNFKKAQSYLGHMKTLMKYVSEKEACALRKLMVMNWTPEEVKNHKDKIIQESGEHLVIKSQWEGGVKYFGEEARAKLDTIDPEEYHVMEQILPKKQKIKYVNSEGQIHQANCVPEVGIYAISIYENEQILQNEYLSYLVKVWVYNKEENHHFAEGDQIIGTISLV